jgi:hypothetical protein
LDRERQGSPPRSRQVLGGKDLEGSEFERLVR